jgi:hypothetical protein
MENTEQLREEMQQMKSRVDQIYYAIIGNEMSKDGGLLKRLSDLEIEVEKLVAFKQRFLWTIGLIAGGSSVLAFLLQMVVSYFIKK